MAKFIKLFICSALLFVITNEAISQKKTNTVVQKDTWKEFVSEEGAFKIKVPLKPKRSVSKIDAAFGKTDIVQNRILTKEYLMTIGFLDFPSEITDEEEIKLRFDNSINSIIANGKSQVISQSDIDLNGYFGREIFLRNGTFNITIREFVVKQRFYILEFVTPVNLPKNRQTAVKNIREKYFNSFEVTNLPEAKFKPTVLPEDFGISIEENIFRSSFFGFSMQMPEDFAFFDDDTLKTIRELAENEAELQDSLKGDQAKFSLKKTAILGGSINEKFSSIVIGAEVVFAQIQLDLAAKELRKNFSKTEKITKDLYKTKISGVDFYRIETLDADGQKQVHLFTVRENLLFQIIFTYRNNSDLPLFDEAVKTIKFQNLKTTEAANRFDSNVEKIGESAVSTLFNLK